MRCMIRVESELLWSLYLYCYWVNHVFIYNPHWICSLQLPVTVVEPLPLKASVEIWCFCQGSVETDVKNSVRNLNLAEVCREIFFPPNSEDWLQLHLSHTLLAWLEINEQEKGLELSSKEDRISPRGGGGEGVVNGSIYSSQLNELAKR